MSRLGLTFADLHKMINDDFAWFDEWANGINTSHTLRGTLVDTDKYDIVPKESYKKQLVANQEQAIKDAEENLVKLRANLKKLKE